jgi:hypothetical protein
MLVSHLNSKPNSEIMARKRRENRTKQQLIERAQKVGTLLKAALGSKQAAADKRAELDQLVTEEMGPLREAEQAAYRELYEASLVHRGLHQQPEELVVTLGKGRDRRKVRMLPFRHEIKKKDGRTVVKQQATDGDGNPMVDGNDQPIMVPVILRVEYGLQVIEETEPERIEISLD